MATSSIEGGGAARVVVGRRSSEVPITDDRRPTSIDIAGMIGYAARMESRIERLCVQQGLKMTGQRRVIARVLSDAEDHPDVEELYRRAAAMDEHISIATVYRTVRLLEERGILERRDFGGGRARYEPTEHGRHYHLIDVDTGRVLEFEDTEHEGLMEQIALRLGFDLVSTRLEIYGRRRETWQPSAQASPPARAANDDKDAHP